MARESFHHGGLKKAAITAALEHCMTHPIDSLDMRKLAATCGVHQRAFYRHFANRADLVAATGQRAFEMLNAEILLKKPSSTRQLLEIYTKFALAAPHRYDLLMGGMDLHQDGELIPAVKSLIGAAVALERTETEGDDQSIRDAVVLKWAKVHGMIDLWRRGVLRGKNTKSVAAYILSLL